MSLTTSHVVAKESASLVTIETPLNASVLQVTAEYPAVSQKSRKVVLKVCFYILSAIYCILHSCV